MRALKEKVTMNLSILSILVIIMMAAVPLFYFYNTNQGYWWDEAVYLGLAKNLYEDQGYWINQPWQESFRPPLFAYMAAYLWKVFGFSEPLVKSIPPLFGILSVIVLFFFVRRLYGDGEIALWSILLLATSHMFLFYSVKFLTESFFIFLITLSLYTFYLGFEKSKWYFPLSTAITAIAFLTRYTALIIMGVYILYLVYIQLTQKTRSLNYWSKITLSTLPYWLGFAIFLLILIPWFRFNMIAYNFPVYAMLYGLGSVTRSWHSGLTIAEWFFYLTHWTVIFGLVGLFAIPGIAVLIMKKNKPHTLIFLTFLLTLMFFIIVPRKEARYLLNFFPIYLITIAVGIKELRVWVHSKVRNRTNITIPAIAVILILINFITGIQMIAQGIPAGSSLKEAGLWIGDRIPEGTTIMSQDIPQLYYTSGSMVVHLPDNTEDLQKTIQDWSISYIVIYSREPSYPEWVWSWEGDEKIPSSIFNRFGTPKEFQEYNKTFVWVYEV